MSSGGGARARRRVARVLFVVALVAAVAGAREWAFARNRASSDAKGPVHG